MRHSINIRKDRAAGSSIPVMLGTLLLLFFTACRKSTQDLAPVLQAEQGAVDKKGKPAALQAVSLKVSVNNASGNNITSDGAGDYIHGSSLVSAQFDDIGNFLFSCGRGGRGNNTYLVRWMNISFSQPIQVFSNPPITGNDKLTAITTVPSAGLAFVPLQSLAVGQSQCVGLTGGSGENWVMNFHRAAEDVPASPSAYAVFTRISTTQWTVAPAGPCSPHSNVCALRNGPDVLYGYYTMPFYFTLTKL